MVIILSRPPVAPPVPVDQWAGLTVLWYGADGSVWDLGSGEEGAVLLRTGTEGMHDPVLTKYYSKSRVVPGARARGWRAEPREVFWPALIYSHNSSDEWRDRYRAFFASIHPSIPGRWRVGYKGAFRELLLTGVYNDTHLFEQDPVRRGWERFGITLEAVQPWWQGDPIELGPWRQPETAPFFPAEGGPSFTISSSIAIGHAHVSNPGDVDSWLTWTAVGPLTSVEIGIGNDVAVIPFNVAAGETLIIDTDPRRQTGTLNGVDVTKQLGLLPYGSIPPGGRVGVHVEANGAGSISASLVPLYFRAI